MNQGYVCRVLYIDLSTGAYREETISRERYEQYLGGMGLAVWLASRHSRPGMRPFAADNPIIITAGTLAGTPAPSSGRATAVTLMPLNGAWGSANSGGNLAGQLKWAGYEALVITGKAEEPVYIRLGDQVELCPASDLWGRGLRGTTEQLWQRHAGSSVMAIGPAGERKIAFALAMVDNMATMGRGGLGAVMGDKRLKAIVVKGQRVSPLAHRSRFFKLSRAVHRRLRSIPWRSDWLQQGIYLGWPVWKGELVTENFSRRLSAEAAKNLSPQAYGAYFRRPLACISCPMADKAVVEVEGCSYPVSYGLHAALSGARWGASDEAGALKAMLDANDWGVDDLTLWAVIGWAVDAYREGIISDADTHGQVLEHTPECYLRVAAQIIGRREIGDVLAEGFLANIERFGPEAAELAVHIKGIDPISDPRPHSSGFLFAQLTNPRGAYVVQGNSPAFNPGKKNASIQRFLAGIGVDENKAAVIAPADGELDLSLLVRYTEDWYAAASSLGICARQPVIQTYDPAGAAQLVEAATGIEMDAETLLAVGERVWNQYRLNNRHYDAQSDRLPPRMYDKLANPDGEDLYLNNYERTRRWTEEDIAAALQRYYRDRGWDSKGVPLQATLKRLQLNS